jgi:hypothetical protein
MTTLWTNFGLEIVNDQGWQGTYVDFQGEFQSSKKYKFDALTEGLERTMKTVGLLDGAMHIQAVLYRTTRIKILCMEGNQWNQGE